jgi:hypothetical protein
MMDPIVTNDCLHVSTIKTFTLDMLLFFIFKGINVLSCDVL